ncbi:ferritin-like domain-containing protein [Janthinobacterium fluminis]|uniref:Ferritin-like domain-containing protein n=1 Tax=Janthinobacterium fluminis TaxID=2987524 RepID=A0ABT5K8F3_9BURK|nr:ferritin-like domain-containing protein [Janthinobacterium fluminis]MDC8760346.1 ferritin-like domain-containing protein [Janthinobacterium fluminis]
MATEATTTPDLRVLALQCLVEPDPAAKVLAVAAMAEAMGAGDVALDVHVALQPDAPVPGRPERPELVPPRLVGRRAMTTLEGRAMLIHALAHIEFNAVNLALDALWRFPGLPPAYYTDWLRVATEEATHFSLLAAHLQVLGYRYGDFPAHDSLWEMVGKTCGDPLARMALVPRTLEARGLDAIPPLRAKLAQAGDLDAAKILDIILRDEVGHVEIGNRWYCYLCQQRGLEPVATYAELAVRYAAPALRGPFNLEARRQAGFTEAELQALS